jgi:DNA recombination protein RmuC
LVIGLFLMLGFSVGGSIGWLIARGHSAHEAAEGATSSVAEIASARARGEEQAKQIALLEADLAEQERVIDRWQTEAIQAREERARLTGEVAQLRELVAGSQAALESRESELRTLRQQLATLRDDHAAVSANLAAERAAGGERSGMLRTEVGRLAATLSAREAELEGVRSELLALKEAHARLALELDLERTVHADRASLVRQAEARMGETFATLSAEALESSTRAFLEMADRTIGGLQQQSSADLDSRRRAIEDLVAPIRESIEKVDGRLREIEDERHDSYAALSSHIRSLATAQETLRAETSSLARALRTPSVRGNWGEVQLRRVIEMAGMTEHCDFTAAGEGDLAPDVIVRLPGGRLLVIDATVPLTAYADAAAAGDELARERCLGEHTRQVREHIARLGARSYWAQFESEPEFVFLFMPGEGFVSAALQRDPALIEFGVRRGVIPASPLTLIALLRAVAFGWRQERLAADAAAVRALGRQLYEELRGMAEHWEAVGSGLSRSIEAYNRAVAAIEQRVLTQARRFGDHGAASPRPLPSLDPVTQVARSLQAIDFAGSLSLAGAPGEEQAQPNLPGLQETA